MASNAPELEVPTPPPEAGSTGQRAATEDERKALLSAPQAEGVEYLGKNLPASLSGLAVSNQELNFNRAGLAALNASMSLLIDGRNDARNELADMKEECVALRDRANQAEIRSAVVGAELEAERSSSSFRLVANGVGCVLLGLIPYADEKGGRAASISIAVLGAALLISAWIFRRNRKRQ